MLGVQSRGKESETKSLDSKIARSAVTSSTSDDSSAAGRYATVQGSKWFREKGVLAGSDTTKGGTPSIQGTPMKPVALVTSVQSNVISSLAQESGEKKNADSPGIDHVNVSIVTPADEDEARRSVLPRLVETTFPCDTSVGTVVSIATSVMQPSTSSFDAPRSILTVATTQSDPARTPVCVLGVAYRSSQSSVTSYSKPQQQQQQQQRGGGSSAASPAAHTSTRVKTLTPFCLRSRRGEDRPLSVSPNPLSLGVRSDDGPSEATFTGSTPHLYTSWVDDATTSVAEGHIKQLSSPIVDLTSMPSTITTQNSNDLNTQVFELTKDMTPSSPTQRPEVHSLASSMPTLTVQATSTRTTAAVQQTSSTGGGTGTADATGGLRSANTTTMKDGHLRSSTDAIPERLSPRPRANIFADIRERVFGAKSPGPSTSHQQFGPSVQQQQQQQQQQQLHSHVAASSQLKESADEPLTSGILSPLKIAAPLAVAEDDLNDADDMDSTHPVGTDEGQPTIPAHESTYKTSTVSTDVQPTGFSCLAASESTLVDSTDNTATLIEGSTMSAEISASVAVEDKVELQPEVKHMASRDQAAQPSSRLDEYAKSRDSQLLKQQRTVARAEVPPWRTMDLPGTQYGVQQFQKSPASSGTAISAVKPVAAVAQERIEMSLPSPTAQSGGFIVASTTSSQEPLTVKMPRTESLTQKSIETAPTPAPALAEEASPRIGNTGNSGRIVPSSVSRVDWAKQRFGATQSLDSSGFSVAPEIQPRRGSGETSPKLPVRNMAMMSSVPEMAVAQPTIAEMPCSPRTYRRLIVSTSGQRAAAPVPLAASLDVPAPVPSTLSRNPATHAAPVSISSGSSKIAVVQGHQVMPSVAMAISTIATPTTAFGVRSAFVQSLPVLNASAMDVGSYGDQTVLPQSTISTTVANSQSRQMPVKPTPIPTSSSTTQTQLPPNFQQKSSTISSTTGSGFSLRMPEPVVRFPPPVMSAAAPAQSDCTTMIDSSRSVAAPMTSSTTAILKQQPASTISQYLSNERSLNQSSGPRQAPHPSAQLQSTLVALASDHHSQRISRQSPDSSVVTSVTSSVSASPQHQLNSTTPQSLHEQVFEFPASSVRPSSTLADSSCVTASLPSSIVLQQGSHPGAGPSRSSVSNDNDEVCRPLSQFIQTTQIVSTPTLRDIDIRAPPIDQVVARPALPTVRALISKPTFPEVHLIAIPLRSAVVIESVITESELFPIAMSAPPPSTSTAPMETPSVSIGIQGSGSHGNSTSSAPFDRQNASIHRSTVAQANHVIDKPATLIGQAATVNNSTAPSEAYSSPIQTTVQESLPEPRMVPPGTSTVNLSSANSSTGTTSRPTMSSMTSPSIVPTSSGEKLPISRASSQPQSTAAVAGTQINDVASASSGQIPTSSQSVPRDPAAQLVSVSMPSIAASNNSRQMSAAASSASVVASVQPTSRSSLTESTRQTIQQQWQSQQQQQPQQQQNQQQQKELQPHKDFNQQSNRQDEQQRNVASANQLRTVQFSMTSTSRTTDRNNENNDAMPERDLQEKQQPQQQQQQQQQQHQRQLQHERASILKKSASESVATSRPALSRQQTLPATFSPPIDTSPRQSKSTGSRELNDVIAELDDIAAETRQLSKSLNVPTSSPHLLQVSPTSSTTRSHGGSRSPEPSSLISAVTAALDARIQSKTAVHPKLAALHETRSLDRSGIARRQLEQLINPVPTSTASGAAAVHKTVALRKPRPLRKAQTISLTGLGLGVDPDLMSLLASRKEKSASDDEDQKTPNSSRSDSKDQDEEEMEKMPSVSERIKKMETKKIRFAVLREKAAQRRMAQSMTSLTSAVSPEDMGYGDLSAWSTGESKASPLASSQSKLDRLACFAAISDSSVGMKRMELQRRHLVAGRRLSQPVTLNELDRTESLQSVTSFNERVRIRVTSTSTRHIRRWMWHRQPTPRDRLAAVSKRNQRRRSLPSSSSISGTVGDRLSAKQRAIMLRSSRYNVALPARVHSKPRVAVEDTSSPPGGSTIIGHGPLTHTERVQPSTSGVWNSPSLPSASSTSSSAYQNTMSRGPSAADRMSPVYPPERGELQLFEHSSFNAPSFVSSRQLVTSLPSQQEMTSRSQVQLQPQMQQQQQIQQQYQYQHQVDTVSRATEQHYHHDFQTSVTPMAAAARLVHTNPQPLTQSPTVTPTPTSISRPPIDRSRTDELQQGAPVVHQRKQHTVQPIRRTIQRMDSLDDDEFDKMVEVNIRQLKVEGGSSGSTAAAANAPKQNTSGMVSLGAPAASPHQPLSPRLARRSPQQQQQQQQQQHQYGATGHASGDTMRTTTVAHRLQGAETETVSAMTSSSHQPVTSWLGSKKPQQQREEQEKKDEESEDELSKLSIADKLKLFSGKKSLSSQQREAEAVAMTTRGGNTAKPKRQMNRHQTQVSDSEPVTWDELEQATQFEASSRAKYGQPVISSGQASVVAGTGHLRVQPPKQFKDHDVSRNVLFYRDF